MTESSTHKRIRHALVKIGELEGFDAQTEYPVEQEFLDGAWLSPGGLQPLIVFEVQVAGNADKAVGKLQRARRMWNCKMVLVTQKSQLPALRALLERTLGHRDMRHSKVVEKKTIDSLKKTLVQIRDMRQELGYESQ